MHVYVMFYYEIQWIYQDLVSGELPRGKFPQVKIPHGEFPWGKFPRGKFPRGKLPHILFSNYFCRKNVSPLKK